MTLAQCKKYSSTVRFLLWVFSDTIEKQVSHKNPLMMKLDSTLQLLFSKIADDV